MYCIALKDSDLIVAHGLTLADAREFVKAYGDEYEIRRE